jgi:nucleoid-associated protein YgaU
LLDSLKKEINPAGERPSLQKAKLQVMNSATGDKLGEINCQFNPQTLTIEKSVSWSIPHPNGKPVEAEPSSNAPELEFGGGKSAKFSLDLIFDTTDNENQDVRGYTNQLLSLTLMGGGESGKEDNDPPSVQFIWGEFLLFEAVVESIQISYTLFLASGIPVRARASVRFIQLFDDDGKEGSQNPTTRTEPRKTHVVMDGDRLDYLAYREYGYAHHWRDIALANDLDDPTQLVAGQILILPPLS